MNLNEFANKIEKAALSVSLCCHLWAQPVFSDETLQTIAEGKHVTGDLGGKASTKEYTQAIITKLAA